MTGIQTAVLRAAVFLGGFLLFQIQPLLGKALLPWFGGAASVWTVCLLYFQTLLLAGYIYAHHTNRWIHMALLLVSLAMLPSANIEPPSGSPAVALLLTLALASGMPYFLLSANSPLLQRWSGLEDPYRLYAVSSFGSLLALLSYPFLFEIWLPLRTQFELWRVLYAGFVVLCVLRLVRGVSHEAAPYGPVPRSQLVIWGALAGTGSGLLAAATSQISQEFGSFPLLWVVPLALYLITYMIAFARPQWYDRRVWTLLATIAIPGASALWVLGGRASVWIHIGANISTLTVCLMILHGELARSKPPVFGLTRFYIAIGGGGALGGAFVALAAPQLFNTYFEFPLLLAATAVLALLQRYREGEFSSWRDLPPLARTATTGFAFALLVPWVLLDTGSSRILMENRNFYGTLRVTEWHDSLGRRRVLTHGSTTHGTQWMDDERRLAPTAYYGRESGVGIALENRQRLHGGPMKTGVIGLGVGTLAAYARPGDHYRFYEINPGVTKAAWEHFAFLPAMAGTPEVIEGDARLQLRHEPPQEYDVLVVDAFSSDAIPAHLLTAECAELYRSHLALNGELLIHITNRTLDLEAVVRGLGRHIGYTAMRVDSPADSVKGTHAATWVHLTPGETRSPAPAVLWTDDFAPIWRAVR